MQTLFNFLAQCANKREGWTKESRITKRGLPLPADCHNNPLWEVGGFNKGRGSCEKYVPKKWTTAAADCCEILHRLCINLNCRLSMAFL
jgi:hypothetical protein